MNKWAAIIFIILLLAGGGWLLMRTSDYGVNRIKQHEALRLKPYRDVAGYWTIGYGHKLRPGEWYDEITEAKAEQLLREDLADAENAVTQLVTVPINQNQYDALVSFVYNVGAGEFADSTLLRKLNKGDYQGAADEFTRWKYAGGKVVSGLLSRREKEQTLFQAVA